MARRGRSAVPEIFFLIRRWRRWRAAFRLKIAILLNRLAFLPANLLACVAHALALVRFRWIKPPDIRRHLADYLFVGALNRNFCLVHDRDLDVFWNRKQNRM